MIDQEREFELEIVVGGDKQVVYFMSVTLIRRETCNVVCVWNYMPGKEERGREDEGERERGGGVGET